MVSSIQNSVKGLFKNPESIKKKQAALQDFTHYYFNLPQTNAPVDQEPSDLTNQTQEDPQIRRDQQIRQDLYKIFGLDTNKTAVKPESSDGNSDKNKSIQILRTHASHTAISNYFGARDGYTRSAVNAAVILFLKHNQNNISVCYSDWTKPKTLNIANFYNFLYNHLTTSEPSASNHYNNVRSEINEGYLKEIEFFPELNLITMGDYWINISELKLPTPANIEVFADKESSLITNQHIRRVYNQNTIELAKQAAIDYFKNNVINNLKEQKKLREEEILKELNPEEKNKILEKFKDRKKLEALKKSDKKNIEDKLNGLEVRYKMGLETNENYKSKKEELEKKLTKLTRPEGQKILEILNKLEQTENTYTIAIKKILYLQKVLDLAMRHQIIYKAGYSSLRTLFNEIFVTLKITANEDKIHFFNSLILINHHRNFGMDAKGALKAPVMVAWWSLPFISGAGMILAGVTTFGVLGVALGVLGIVGASVEFLSDLINLGEHSATIGEWLNCGDSLDSTTNSYNLLEKELLELLPDKKDEIIQSQPEKSQLVAQLNEGQKEQIATSSINITNQIVSELDNFNLPNSRPLTTDQKIATTSQRIQQNRHVLHEQTQTAIRENINQKVEQQSAEFLKQIKNQLEQQQLIIEQLQQEQEETVKENNELRTMIRNLEQLVKSTNKDKNQ